jgi:hypothetical protein
MQNKKKLSVSLFAILSLFHFYYGIIPAWTRINSDFPNYYVSSRLLLEGKDLNNIYDDEWFQQKIIEYGISEPESFPFLPDSFHNDSALLSPFRQSLYSYKPDYYFWFISSENFGFSFISTFNIILLSGAALVNNFLFGQFYLILLLLILLGYINLNKNNETSAGIFWGIGAAVKYFPLIYLPILFFNKSWKTLISLASTVVFINLGIVLFKLKLIYFSKMSCFFSFPQKLQSVDYACSFSHGIPFEIFSL